MLLLAAFAVPSALARQVLLYGIVGALVLRAIFIGLGAAALQSGTWAFLLFGGILILTAGKIVKDVMAGGSSRRWTSPPCARSAWYAGSSPSPKATGARAWSSGRRGAWR
ncbi:TerC family protein [Nonomuraea salmonea]|uniref:TerC family protein n=1 Tax=Nonomuraea salmonea TaxID=46181 RepID=UPI0031E6AD46